MSDKEFEVIATEDVEEVTVIWASEEYLPEDYPNYQDVLEEPV